MKPRNDLITKLSGALTVLVLFQATFGYLTVSLKLWPQIVSIHLLGGFATTTLIFLIYIKLKELYEDKKNLYPMSSFSIMSLNIAFPVLIIQIILGVWLSSNYASLACPDFPLCQGQIIPEVDFKMGFNFLQSIGPDYLGGQLDHEARLAIHVVHRFGAAVVTAYFLFLIVILAKENQYRFAKILTALLFLQVALGISNIIYSLPLYVAIAHNLGALLLLISISYFRLKVSGR
jgi:cytochrome c oxidase assembly protein subunit 15